MSKKNFRRNRIKKKIRGKIHGTAEKPRLSVFRSNKEIYAQLINDEESNTLAFASSLKSDKGGKNKTEVAYEVGKQLAAMASDKGIKKVVFDRNGYLYHGRVKAVAEGSRANGLKF